MASKNDVPRANSGLETVIARVTQKKTYGGIKIPVDMPAIPKRSRAAKLAEAPEDRNSRRIAVEETAA